MGANLVSVVIPVKNGAETLEALLRQLYRQNLDAELEVVIVDSGSRDESLAIASRYPVRVLRIEPSEFDHGETRNLGIREAKGEWVALLTQDAVPAEPHFLASLFRPLRDRRVCGVYGRQIARIDADVVTRRNLERWLTGRSDPAISGLEEDTTLDTLSPMRRYELCLFDNVCSALKRRVWEVVPFVRTGFGEDIRWGRDVIERGWSIAYAPGAAVFHSHRRSVRYEFERTRICHETLHELFGLSTLPRLRYLPGAFAVNLRNDVSYAWRFAPAGLERVRQTVRAAALSVASPLAQYLGICDAQRRRSRSAKSTPEQRADQGSVDE